MSDLDMLRRLGDQLVPPPLDALRETARAATGGRPLRRRWSRRRPWRHRGRRAAARPRRAGREPRPAETPTQIAPTSRPLTYADGSTIHYGDQTVEAAGPVVELDLTDEGVAFRTADGQIWFTDGSSGRPARRARRARSGVPGRTSWPLLRARRLDGLGQHRVSLAWFEFPRPGEPESSSSTTPARARCAPRRGHPRRRRRVPALVSDEYVYWYDDPTRTSPASRAERPLRPGHRRAGAGDRARGVPGRPPRRRPGANRPDQRARRRAFSFRDHRRHRPQLRHRRRSVDPPRGRRHGRRGRPHRAAVRVRAATRLPATGCRVGSSSGSTTRRS